MSLPWTNNVSGTPDSGATPADSGLPPTGTMVTARVAENLGDGLYSLLWGQKKITVSSRAELAVGQNLLLKSETSPDGKQLLVVQLPGAGRNHPAPVPGPVIYTQQGLTATTRPISPVATPVTSANTTSSTASILVVLEELPPVPSKAQIQAELAASRDKMVADLAVTDVEIAEQPFTKDSPDKPTPEQADSTQPQPPTAKDESAPQVPGQEASSNRPVLPATPDSPLSAGPQTKPTQTDSAQPQSPPTTGEAAFPAPQAPAQGLPSGQPVAAPPLAAADLPPVSGSSISPLLPESPQPALPNGQTPLQPEASTPETAPNPATPLPGQTGEAVVEVPELIVTIPKYGSVMPKDVMERAAEILLRAAGLTPGPATREAAEALIRNQIHVDRPNIQALLALTAGQPEAEKYGLLEAGARLLSKDIPLAVPLASGLAGMLERGRSAADLLGMAESALAEVRISDAKAYVGAAREMLGQVTVELGRNESPAALERHLTYSAREPLGKALQLMEQATQTILESHPLLTKLDSLITSVLTMLEEMKPGATPGNVAPHQDRPPLPPQNAPQNPETATPQTKPTGGEAPIPLASVIPPRGQTAAPIPALVVPSLPDAPKSQPGSTAPAGQQPINGGLLQGSLENNAPMPGKEESVSKPAIPLPDADAEAGQTKPQSPEMAADKPARRPLPDIVPHPGANRPEYDLLRKSGYLDTWLSTPDQSEKPTGLKDLWNAPQEKRDMLALARDLLATNPEKAEQAARELPLLDKRALRELASRLLEVEKEIVAKEPAIRRLAEAAGAIRELGRHVLATKIESLAGMDRNPGMMVAEVPFRLAGDAGNGRLQMFYRKGGQASGKGGWSSRIILDLTTTAFGPVLGDARFFGRDMTLNMFVESDVAAAFLAKDEEELVESLLEKGFRLKPRFMSMPTSKPEEDKPPVQETPAPQPPDSAAALDPRFPRKPKRLDTKA